MAVDTRVKLTEHEELMLLVYGSIVLRNKEATMMLRLANGDRYEAAHVFAGETRAIINYEGVFVMVDRFSPSEWELSGEPARPGVELKTLNALVKSIEGTTITVTKDPETDLSMSTTKDGDT